MAEVYLNGAFVPAERAQVSVMDRGFLFADGVYEVIPAYGGQPLREAAHLDRLRNSLRGIRLPEPLSHAEWRDVFRRLLAGAPGTDQAIYVQVTRGAAAVRDHRFPSDVEPTLFAMTKPLVPRDPALAERGVSAVVRDDIRWDRCDIKSIALLAAVLLRQEAAEADAEETILVRGGQVTEGATSNVFIVRRGALITPPKSRRLLAGITRELVLELARGAGIDCEERPIDFATLRSAEEVWLTSSTREVMPVTRLDGTPVGTARPGPLWRRMNALYQELKASVRKSVGAPI